MVKKWSVSYPAVNGTEQRRVYVYLPTMYEADPDRRYPVLYMFDGQNVFFDEDATFGKSWGVADYLDYTDTPLIVAAVECNAGANNERLVEYSPYRFDDPQFGHFDGTGQATMSWYIHRFKPFIDRNFRTLPDREHTFIGGSSTGVTVIVTGTDTILFEFDCGGSENLGILPIETREKTVTWFRGYRYYGGFEYQRVSGGNINVINVVDLEDYVKCVIPWEMSKDWPVEALKAQAVCARTYAVCQTKHRAQGFDICATTHCQVYQGTAASGANSDAAVDQTTGEFLYYSGRLVQEAVYYSSNGGASEDSLNVWGNDVGYLKGKIDPYEGKIASIIPRYNWSTTFTASELTTLLNNRGYGIGTVKNAYVSAYTDTGNVYSVTFTGTSGSKTVSREACRTLLNLRSQRFTIGGGTGENIYSVNDTGESVALGSMSAIDSSGKNSALSGNVYVITSSGTSQLVQRTTTSSGSGSFVISGSGYGHNVGMSQWGAYSMANLGYSYRDILQFYYTDVSIR